MSLKKKRLVFFIIWLVIVLSGPITVFRNTSFSAIFNNNLVLINVFQRILGLLAFSLLLIQIVLGSSMSRLVQFIGAKAYRLHITQGLLTYGFAFIHPLFYYVLTYKTVGKIMFFLDPGDPNDIWISFGRIAFSLLTISTIAGYFRTKPFFRRNWRVFHMINYAVFYLVAVHYWYVGSDSGLYPFVVVYWLSLFIVTGIVLRKLVLGLLSGNLVKAFRQVLP